MEIRYCSACVLMRAMWLKIAFMTIWPVMPISQVSRKIRGVYGQTFAPANPLDRNKVGGSYFVGVGHRVLCKRVGGVKPKLGTR